MADQQSPMSGAFSNPYVDTVAAQVNEDFVTSQNERRDQENSLLQGEQKLAAAGQKTGDAQYKARLKAEQDYLKSVEKQKAAAKKEESNLLKDVPIVSGKMWNSHAAPMVKFANYLRENISEIIEEHGVDGTYAIIETFSSSVKDISSGFNPSFKQSTLLAQNIGGDLGGDDIEGTTQEEYDQRWEDFNNGNKFSFELEGTNVMVKNSEGSVPIRDWASSEYNNMITAWASNPKPNLWPGIATAFEKTYMPGKKKDMSVLSTWLDEKLSPNVMNLPTSRDKKHYLTALAVYAQNNDITYEELSDTSVTSAEARVAATEEYKEQYMEMARKNKEAAASGSGSSVTAESVMSEAVGTPYGDEGTRSFLAEEFNLGIMPQDLEATGIIGLATTKPVDLNISSTAARSLNIVPDTDSNTLNSVKINAAAFSSEGDMFIQFKGRMNKSQEEIDADQARLLALGIIGEASTESLQHSYGVIEYGSDEWINAVEAIGAKRASTVSKKKAIKSKYGDITDDRQVNFWVGLASLAEETNSRFINEVLSAVESEGITIDEIRSLAAN